jgi:putative transposase
LRGRKPVALCLEESVRLELETLVRKHSTPQQIGLRARIVLLAHQGYSHRDIAQQLDISEDMVAQWRQRWLGLQALPYEELSCFKRLADAPRAGAPALISAEAYCQIMAMACQPPENYGRPITQWTARELAEEAVRQAVVPTISPRQVGRFLKKCGSQAPLKPLLADP